MKKTLSVILAVLMLLTALPFAAVPAGAETFEDFEYGILYDDTVEITNYVGFATDLTIPAEIDGKPVTSIEEGAFSHCESLASIEIPNSVTSIGGGAFYGCTSLTEINVSAGNNTYSSINGVLFNKDKTEIICYPKGKGTSYSIPSGVTSIGDRAFDDCENLTSIEIPDSVTIIGDFAFQYCTGLTNITIPSGVTSIGDLTFFGCTALESIEIPDSVTSIGGSVFFGCTSLTSIEIPDSVTGIGSYAFYDCTSLASVTIGNSVTSIGDWAFYHTGITSVKIPESVMSIGEGAFASCLSLESIEIPDSVTSIGKLAFYEYENNGDPGSFVSEPLEDLTIYGIEGSCSQIYAQENGLNFIPIFETEEKTDGTIEITGYNAPASKITIPSKINGKAVTSISASAFANNASLEKITIPDSVVEIAAGAFSGCSEKLVISASANSAAEAYAKENGITFEEIKSAAQLGNVNGDEDINATDATLVLQYFAKIITDSAPNFDTAAADVNNDNEINATDATLILQYFAKIITKF